MATRPRRWRATEVSGWLTMVTRYRCRPAWSWQRFTRWRDEQPTDALEYLADMDRGA